MTERKKIIKVILEYIIDNILMKQINTISDKRKLREFTAISLALKEMLEEFLQAEGKSW